MKKTGGRKSRDTLPLLSTDSTYTLYIYECCHHHTIVLITSFIALLDHLYVLYTPIQGRRLKYFHFPFKQLNFLKSLCTYMYIFIGSLYLDGAVTYIFPTSINYVHLGLPTCLAGSAKAVDRNQRRKQFFRIFTWLQQMGGIYTFQACKNHTNNFYFNGNL